MEDEGEEGPATLRAPSYLLGVAAVFAGAALVAWWLADSDSLNAVGLALNSVAFFALLFYKRRAVVASHDPLYEEVEWVRWVLPVLAIAILVIFPLNAFPIAEHLAEK